MEDRKNRTIYGRRQARPLKETQKHLLENFLHTIKIHPGKIPETFPGDVIFEIGFGSGENLIHQAQISPKALCIGCEPFMNGVAALISKIMELNIENIAVYDDDAKFLLEALPYQVISKAFILFPDPWPKKRHHKRRVVNLENLLLLHSKMKKDAELIIATDHPGYLDWILEISSRENFIKHFKITHTHEMPRPSEAEIPVTRYEKKALENLPGAFLKFKVI